MPEKEKLKFYDVKARKSFTTTSYKIKMTKNNRRMAVAKAPSGVKATRFLPNK